jgi:nucleoside-diphosphate-sugar epimerase
MSTSYKIFLLGCSGTVGAGLTRRLCSSGATVFGVRGSRPCLVNHPSHLCTSVNLLETDLSPFFVKYQPELLLHTSWEMTPKSYWNDPINFMWADKSTQIIRQFMDLGGAKVVVTGSCAEYLWGDLPKLNESAEESPSSIYGEAKLQLLNSIRQDGFPYLWTRTFFQFGGERDQTKLIPMLINSAISGASINLSSPNDIRDFIHIDDVTNTLTELIVKKCESVVNIGSGVGHRIVDIVDLIEAEIGRRPEIIFPKEDKPIDSVVSDTAHLRNLLHSFEPMPLNHAIKCKITEYLNLN